MKIAIVIIGAVCALIACMLAAIALTFGYLKNATGKATATIINTKHKKNVRVNGGRYSHGRDTLVKDVTYAEYCYKVENKIYRVKHTYYYTTPRQTDRIVRVVYIRCLPCISYVDDCVGASAPFMYGAAAVLLAVFSAVLLIIGIPAVIS